VSAEYRVAWGTVLDGVCRACGMSCEINHCLLPTRPHPTPLLSPGLSWWPRQLLRWDMTQRRRVDTRGRRRGGRLQQAAERRSFCEVVVCPSWRSSRPTSPRRREGRQAGGGGRSPNCFAAESVVSGPARILAARPFGSPPHLSHSRRATAFNSWPVSRVSNKFLRAAICTGSRTAALSLQTRWRWACCRLARTTVRSISRNARHTNCVERR